MRGVLKITAAKAPGFGDNRKSMLQDMAVLTGGELISDDLGLKMENVGVAQLGRVKKVEQDKDNTVLTATDDVDVLAVQERCEQLRSSIEATKSDYEKEKMQEEGAEEGVRRRCEERRRAFDGRALCRRRRLGGRRRRRGKRRRPPGIS